MWGVDRGVVAGVFDDGEADLWERCKDFAVFGGVEIQKIAVALDEGD